MNRSFIDGEAGGLMRPAGLLAFVLSVATLVALAGLHVLSAEFDPSWRMVSEYALGGYGWLLSVMFACWGISTWALAVATAPVLPTRSARVGLVFLGLAGLGEVMAAVFDITQEIPHGIAGLLGVGGLPIAAMLISRSWPRRGSSATGRKVLRGLAILTCIAVAALVGTLALMTVQVAQAYGGQLPQVAPVTLPPGVLRLIGWADRLIVVGNCLWVAAVAWQVMRRSWPVVSNEAELSALSHRRAAARPIAGAEPETRTNANTAS